ncbi:DHA2 family efflux MFS transporter permease subunit [Bacillus seohaeanensis]|jgi:EmrB/QacA subfamily drug resistance transporter|uniref:DHA2 family efflux MFS transporter permease subunit n=1 Tax=Bacillus seohaeanensis TaxID=284580 RepID=A0ABW5RND0_9BACI
MGISQAQTTQAHTTPEIKIAPLVAVLISGAFAAILNQTLLATALPHIMADLSITANTAQWLTTIFMLVNGVMIPITAFLIGRFTTRSLFLTAMALFATGTLICAVAPNFSLLMVGRIVQASGAGIIMPLMQTVFFVIFPVEKRGSAMGLFGLVIAFAPAIGPTLSGWLVDQYPWRVLFYIVLPIAIIDFIVAYFILKNVTERTFPKLDILSIILSTFGFGGLLYGFSTAGTHGWGSAEVIIPILIGVASLFIFIMRQLKLEQPILEFRVFKYGIFTLSTALGMMVFIAMIGGATILPIYMQNMHHFTAFESGLMLLPGALIMGIMSPISGKIFDKVGAKWLAITGLTIVTISTFFFTNLSSDTSFTFMAIVNAIRMFGVALVMMPTTTAGINQLPSRLIPHGTAMNNTMRQVSGSIGTALLVTVMTNNVRDPQTYGMEGIIHGVNVSFIVAGVVSGIGIILAFFLRKTSPAEE